MSELHGINTYSNYVTLKTEKGVNDYQVALATNITKSTFSDWKSGRSQPKVDKLMKLSEYFGVPLEYFLKEN